jgi:alkanesulfonate monooxygenase SsuD/methylene tetrahydromethanopterin reductase-like flavin-dependent oxidoreductase (luciferase family)
MLFSLRFDFRNPPLAHTSMADRYAAALDMVEWADALGCVSIGVSEHHGSADGYLPSPVPMLAAMAQRSTTARLAISALIVSFHDPLRIAEDLAVLDNLSRGRVDLVVAAGYAREEFAMFDVPMNERPKRVTEMVETLRKAFTGQPFLYRGRTVQVTPAPYQPGGPRIVMGGGSEPAARRAARIGDGFVPSVPGAWHWYQDEMVRLGKPDPGPFPGFDTVNVALATDPKRGWEQMAPFFLHEMNAYGAWQAQDNVSSPYRTVADTEELRASGRYRVLTPEQYISELQARPSPFVTLHPLCGGMPPDVAWESLRLFEHEVVPAFKDQIPVS